MNQGSPGNIRVLSENIYGKTTKQRKPGSSPSLWDSPCETGEDPRTNLVALESCELTVFKVQHT